jgi:hypothetical protein
MKNVPEAKVNILMFIQEHGSEVIHNMADKFAGR